MSSPRTSAELELAIWDALQSVVDPELGVRLVDLGMIRSVEVLGDRVAIDLALTTPGCPLADVLVEEVCAAARDVTGVTAVTVQVVDMPESQVSAAPWRAWLSEGDERPSGEGGREAAHDG
ncbi:MAG: hypothetical protein RLZZ387_768 [Chloroflexota bacterium]|jgi:metal-sulfur cluster biosynthetic enzyme